MSDREGKGVVFEPDDPHNKTRMNGSLLWNVYEDHSYLPICPTMGISPRSGCRAQAANFSGLYDEETKKWSSFPNVFAAYKGSHDRNGSMTVGYGFNTNWVRLVLLGSTAV